MDERSLIAWKSWRAPTGALLGILLVFMLAAPETQAQTALAEIEDFIREQYEQSIRGVVAIHLRSADEAEDVGMSALQLSPVGDELLAAIYNKITGSATPSGTFGLTKETISDRLMDKVNRAEGIGLVFREVPEPAEISGTGFLVSDRGHIVTIGQLFASYIQTPKISVTFSDGYTAPAQLHGIDSHTNIAVLVCDTPHGQPLTLSEARAPAVGSLLVAVTCPYGLPPSAHFGHVSGLRRKVGPPDSAGTRYERYIQTDLPLHPGGHGGPVTDRSGRVIGMLAATVKQESWREISFIIPAEILGPISRELMERGSVARGFLGVSLANEISGDASFANPGVLIAEVAAGSPAETAGILPGDRILRVADEATDNADDFVWAIARRHPGETVELSLFRQGSLVQVPVTLAESTEE